MNAMGNVMKEVSNVGISASMSSPIVCAMASHWTTKVFVTAACRRETNVLMIALTKMALQTLCVLLAKFCINQYLVVNSVLTGVKLIPQATSAAIQTNVQRKMDGTGVKIPAFGNGTSVMEPATEK